jgi:putative nucleotidyltransferase with HDIG domain
MMVTSSASAGETAALSARDFLSVRLASLQPNTVLNFDLYLRPQPDAAPVFYREKSLPFTVETKKRLRDHNVEELYIFSNQEADYHHYLEHNLSSLVADYSVPLQEKTQLLYNSAHRTVDQFMSAPEAGDMIPRSKALVDNLVQFMFKEESYFSLFLATSSFDYQVYTHSVNVFVYCVSLARFLNRFDESFLREFGTAALLHDIGKSRVDPDIINCPGALSADQWTTMKKHPAWGEEILRGHGVDSEIVLDVTRHHHEKITGKGYPDGLKGDQIKPYVRISTICDIFDALTTKRPYKDAIGTFPALHLMHEEMGDDLDPELFCAFVEMMAFKVHDSSAPV